MIKPNITFFLHKESHGNQSSEVVNSGEARPAAVTFSHCLLHQATLAQRDVNSLESLRGSAQQQYVQGRVQESDGRGKLRQAHSLTLLPIVFNKITKKSEVSESKSTHPPMLHAISRVTHDKTPAKTIRKRKRAPESTLKNVPSRKQCIP